MIMTLFKLQLSIYIFLTKVFFDAHKRSAVVANTIVKEININEFLIIMEYKAIFAFVLNESNPANKNPYKYIFCLTRTLILYYQKEFPGKELESNWLPTPEGPFYAVLRLFGLEENALNGSWVNPPMKKLN